MAGGRRYEMTTAKRTDTGEKRTDTGVRLIRDPDTGRGEKQYCLKNAEETTIGRGREADICIVDSAVSRKHASICRTQDGGYVLKNISDNKETRLNQKPVEGEAKLKHGDRIELTPGVVLRFFLDIYEAATKPNATWAWALKVILNADVVGYSCLVEKCGADLTRERLDQCYTESFWPEHTRHHADHIEKVGDNILVVFSSVKDSISYAKAVHRSFAKFNQPLPVAEQIQFRMGIDCGDVVFDAGGKPGQCVCGDAVNFSERIQGSAPKGGVWVSEVTYKQLAQVYHEEFECVRGVELEKVSGPIDLYRLKLD